MNAADQAEAGQHGSEMASKRENSDFENLPTTILKNSGFPINSVHSDFENDDNSSDEPVVEINRPRPGAEEPPAVIRTPDRRLSTAPEHNRLGGRTHQPDKITQHRRNPENSNNPGASQTDKADFKDTPIMMDSHDKDSEQTAPAENSSASQAALNSSNTKVVLPVYPPDSYAILSGKRYSPNASGDIVFDLPEGHYNVTLTCKDRCNKQTYALNVPKSSSGNDPIKLNVVSLEWADATLQVIPPKNTETYFVARRLDGSYRKIHHLIAKSPNAINGFNAFGKEIQLEIYAIPKDTVLTSYEVADLERAKLASTRISLAPGESKTLTF